MAGSIGPIGSEANTFKLVANGGPSKKRGHSSAVSDFNLTMNGEVTVVPEKGLMIFRLTPRDLMQNLAGLVGAIGSALERSLRAIENIDRSKKPVLLRGALV
jgi:hypothetical protein